MSIKKIVVITSGGDAPGMNAALRAVVRTALRNKIEIVGAKGGYAGLVDQNLVTLSATSVANCIQRGGTILKTGRCVEFRQSEVRQRCGEFLQSQGIDSLVVLGGNGSFQGAQLLGAQSGLRVIGIPCTIDNDIPGTDYCIGFDTACNTAVAAIDKIRDTAFSLDRNFLIEVMGRATGHLAVEVGIAGGAEMIVIPEFPITAQQVVEKLTHRMRPKMASIMVMAEAHQPGHSLQFAQEIEQQCGVTYTVCILGHTQRGGTPSSIDRNMGSLMGYEAVKALQAGQSCRMIALQNNRITTTEFPSQQQPTRFFTDRKLVELNNIICDIA